MAKFAVPHRLGVPAVGAARARSVEEAVRVVRENLVVALGDLANPIVAVTSANSGEGKTSTCVSLARSFAATGSRVVVVDLDLRKPDAHIALGAGDQPGVADVLLGDCTFEECMQRLTVRPEGLARFGELHLLAAGRRVPNPTELLAMPATETLLQKIAAAADIVLIDAPPVLPVADTLIIGRLVTGAVLVVETGNTSIPAARRARDALARNQTHLLGVVLSNFTSDHSGENDGVLNAYGN